MVRENMLRLHCPGHGRLSVRGTFNELYTVWCLNWTYVVTKWFCCFLQ